MNAFLEVKDLSCGYRSGFRIEDVSFCLDEGSFGGIIGPNGSGKTTLFRGITGGLPLLRGQVLLEGRDLASMPIRQKAQRIAIVPQFTEVADVSVEEYVMMGRLPYRGRFQFFDRKSDVEMVHHYMNLTNTYPYRRKLLSQLSGGERQMASIASALAQEPRLLLLDEPTAHLDITHQMQFMNLIQRLNDDMRLTVIMIVHDLSLAGEYCNRLLMMQGGRVFCQGMSEDVLTYANVERVYGSVVIVDKNPVSGKPVVFPVSERMIRGR